jgi:hypothetical protein
MFDSLLPSREQYDVSFKNIEFTDSFLKAMFVI